jgi:hypothetical protein
MENISKRRSSIIYPKGAILARSWSEGSKSDIMFKLKETSNLSKRLAEVAILLELPYT